MPLISAYQPRCVNLFNIFGVFHLLEMIVAIATIAGVASAASTGPPNEFGFVLFVGILAAIYSLVWCSTLIFGVWPSSTPLIQYVRLVGGFIMSQFYLAAFAVSCVVASTAHLCSALCVAGVCEFEKAHLFSFGAAAVFTAAGWVLQAVDTFIAWWWYGGINSPSQRQLERTLDGQNDAHKHEGQLNNASKQLPPPPPAERNEAVDAEIYLLQRVEVTETEIGHVRSSKRRETEL